MKTTTINPSSELKDRWYEHGLTQLGITRKDFEAAGGQFNLLDVGALNSRRVVARDVVREKSQREIGSPDKYDPLVATQQVIIVRFGRDFHVMNGNNRVFKFGSSTTNPNNCALPAFVLGSPEAFEKLFGIDAWSGFANARLFNFAH